MLIKLTNTSATAIGDIEASGTAWASLSGISLVSFDLASDGSLDALHFHSTANSPINIQDISSANANWANLDIEIYTEYPTTGGVLVASN